MVTTPRQVRIGQAAQRVSSVETLAAFAIALASDRSTRANRPIQVPLPDACER